MQGAWADTAIYPPLAREIECDLGYSKGELDQSFLDSVWTLCQMQAALLNEVDEGCSLLSSEAILDANWVADTEAYQGNGLTVDDHCLIAKPLASDLLHWLKVKLEQSVWSSCCLHAVCTSCSWLVFVIFSS